MYHFFIEPSQVDAVNKTISILGDDVNHIRNVLRMKEGEEITVTASPEAASEDEPAKQYRCRIREFGEAEIFCDLCAEEDSGAELPSKIYLFQGLPKGDKMETIIQKTVELGVYEVVPVAMNRCVVKLDAKKAGSKVTRWQAIAEAAAKQSGRGRIPNIAPVCSFKEALAYADQEGISLKLIPYELAEGMEATKKLIESVKPGEAVGIIIGPEGGLEQAEVEQAKATGFSPITLGKRILRTETAGMTVVSWLMYQLER
ncbi:MAG: 16S rRNA (uracil(1498)-N(3))-methyltransferase [Lachnospiraceae bacterium]|nr:16S rRNA (uracil(1498)-N(3))-methyltransferase [Lachnospiraceae bacterium]